MTLAFILLKDRISKCALQVLILSALACSSVYVVRKYSGIKCIVVLL